MKRFVYVNVELQDNKIQELKKKTGESTTKEALSKAINHSVNCFMSEKDENRTYKAKKRRNGRTPVHLKHLFEEAVIK